MATDLPFIAQVPATFAKAEAELIAAEEDRRALGSPVPLMIQREVLRVNAGRRFEAVTS